MESLGDLQRKFTLLTGKLIIYAYEQGYELTFGEGYVANKTGHKPDSNHYIKLAQDLNAFKNKVWLDKGAEMEKAHNLLHDYWDSLGGAPRIKNDLNHYSMVYQGRW